MKIIKNLLLGGLLLVTTTILGQTKISGTILDETGEPLPGASVVERGITNGTSTDFDGNFVLNTKFNSGAVVVSFVGYGNKVVSFTNGGNLGKIQLTADGNFLDEVVIKGLVDVAKDRKTPVAVSTIKVEEIQDKLGSQEFPEILNTTPSVYATKSGGGFGDARINIRGFSQENIAVLVNGVPVNDMENSKVYWSNWAGLSDVTTAMQVQRGLGSSKLAISSVGGTVNIITKTTDKKEGGSLSTTFGNDMYSKLLATYSTGKKDNGFAASFLLSRTSGDGYVDGTDFIGYNYFVGLGYEIDDAHDLQFMLTGAPQTHHKRTNEATLADYLEYGKQYNFTHGFLNGQEFNWKRNFYHKPVMSLNWNWDINENSSLSTSAYLSWGRGGGTGDVGKLSGISDSSKLLRDKYSGLVLWDKIVDYNKGKTVLLEGKSYTRKNDGGINDSRTGLSRRASINSHNWYGLLANYNTKLTEELALDFGVDLRDYTGEHYRRLDNLLGAKGYKVYRDKNRKGDILNTVNSSDLSSLWNVFKSSDEEEKILYHNDGKVRWYGAFTQLEYSKDDISAFVQGGVSNQGFKRIDYFNYLTSDSKRESDWQNFIGGNIKAGINYNINEKHNVFVNGGYYSKQPFFDAVFLNYLNDINKDARNEKIIGLELGYGLRTEDFTFNANLYRTKWADKFYRVRYRDGDVRGNADIQGVEQIHMGIELDGTFNVTDEVKFFGMLSIGDWEYGKTVKGVAFDNDQNKIGDVMLHLDGVKVGDAAQTTGRIGLEAELFRNFKVDYSQRFADRLYARISPTSFNKSNHKGSLRLPAYALADIGASYKVNFKEGSRHGMSFRINVNNLFNTEYISESATNYFDKKTRGFGTYYKGIDQGNRVFFGFGTTWNFSIRYNF